MTASSGTRDLHRHLAVAIDVLGDIDRGHAAATQFTRDSVTVSERGFQPIDLVVHAIRKMEPGERDSQRSMGRRWAAVQRAESAALPLVIIR